MFGDSRHLSPNCHLDVGPLQTQHFVPSEHAIERQSSRHTVQQGANPFLILTCPSLYIEYYVSGDVLVALCCALSGTRAPQGPASQKHVYRDSITFLACLSSIAATAVELCRSMPPVHSNTVNTKRHGLQTVMSDTQIHL